MGLSLLMAGCGGGGGSTTTTTTTEHHVHHGDASDGHYREPGAVHGHGDRTAAIAMSDLGAELFIMRQPEHGIAQRERSVYHALSGAIVCSPDGHRTQSGFTNVSAAPPCADCAGHGRRPAADGERGQPDSPHQPYIYGWNGYSS